MRAGYFRGDTTQSIVRQIIGTRGMGYKDGHLAAIKRDATILVRTATQNMANIARQETYRENDDIIRGWQFVATLDDRTCPTCGPLDGNVYGLGEGPQPPIHPQCRCTSVPALDEAFAGLEKGATRVARDADGNTVIVDADMTYYEWLKTQDADFQDAVLGKTRGALLRDGGLTAKRFAELNLGRDFKPRTLDEMRGMDDADFKRAFGAVDEARAATRIDNFTRMEDLEEYVKLHGAMNITQQEVDTIFDKKHGYAATPNNKNINGHLRFGNPVDRGSQKTIDVLTEVTERNSLPNDYQGFRNMQPESVKLIFGVDNGMHGVEGFFQYDMASVEKTVEDIKGLIGQSFEEKGFMSISMIDNINVMQEKPVQMTLLMPQGLKGAAIGNWNESEFIATRGTKIEIVDAKIINKKDPFGDDKYYINIIAKLSN